MNTMMASETPLPLFAKPGSFSLRKISRRADG